MKKSLLLLLAAFMLSLTAGAVTLAPNQLLIGHYTSDDLDAEGWGQGYLAGVNPIATDLTSDELAIAQGAKIVAFRIGLAEACPISRLFVILVGTDGKPTDEIVEWPCNVDGQVGWNMIELEAPYEINIPEGYKLRVGFDYEQFAKDNKPISAVKVGTVYPSYILRNNRWMNYGLNTAKGNLSLQCVVESDNFPQYIIRTRNLTCSSMIVVGNPVDFSFETCNIGLAQAAAGEVIYDIAIDGTVVKTVRNPEALTSDYSVIAGSVDTDGLAGGTHTLTVTPVTVKGEPIADPQVQSANYEAFEHGFSRQMRLVEQFTSTYCTWCPDGTANVRELCDMRGDIAWVAIHENMNGTDPFRNAQTDSIASFEGIDALPEGTFDRTAGISSASRVYCVLSETNATIMNSFMDYVEDLQPSWATVNVNSTYDAATRKAVITINGDLVPNYEDRMGTDSKLTVYITEDGLVARQINHGIWIEDYVHDNVLRKALVSVKGVALKKTGDTYKNEFTVDIPTTWNADKLNIVAFISRPLGNALTDIYVTNANKRKLGECDEPAALQGDVDGDGKVSIDDVTVLIDSLLSGDDPANPAGADCNGDGIISIDDVTTLIDYLLRGEWAQ